MKKHHEMTRFGEIFCPKMRKEGNFSLETQPTISGGGGGGGGRAEGLAIALH